MLNLIWSDIDFERMNWHDCKLYGIAFNQDNFEIIFDIDYITEWVRPPDESALKFWVAPATLIFKNVYDLKIDLYLPTFQILEIARENPREPKNAPHIKEKLEFDWIIETTAGTIDFKSTGYIQHGRMKARLQDQQFLNLVDRGGVSFQ